MLYLVDAFFRLRALQRRYSHSVTPTAGGFLHTAPPIWAGAGQAFSFWAGGTLQQGLVVSAGPCSAEYLLPTHERAWGVQLPYRVGSYEELVLSINTLPSHPLVWVLSDPQGDMPRVDRASLTADVLVLMPTPASQTAVSASAAAGGFLGHLREAVQGANASLTGLVELAPQALSEALPAELVIVRARLTLYETIQTSSRYEMQV